MEYSDNLRPLFDPDHFYTVDLGRVQDGFALPVRGGGR